MAALGPEPGVSYSVDSVALLAFSGWRCTLPAVHRQPAHVLVGTSSLGAKGGSMLRRRSKHEITFHMVNILFYECDLPL
jgi:hypothetical protein